MGIWISLEIFVSGPFRQRLDDASVFQEMDIAVGNAFAIADTYIGILTDVLNGKIGAEGVVEFLGGPAEAE